MSAAGSLEGLQRSIDSQKVRNKKDGMATGGMAKKKDFPDLTGDGKVTQKDILKAEVFNTGGKSEKGMAMGGMAKGMPAGGMKKKKNMSGGGMAKKKEGYAMGGPMKKGYKKGGAVGGKRKGKVRGVRIASKGFEPAKNGLNERFLICEDTTKAGQDCPKGKNWAKRTFDTYPSAYANMATSKYCKDPNYAKKSKKK